MATRKTTKKSPAKKKPEVQIPALPQGPLHHPNCTPQGFAVPCMPLRAFVDYMEGQSAVNPFYKESYLDSERADIHFDLLDGWICHKVFDEDKNGHHITRICRLPEGYSVIDVWRKNKVDDLPYGKWIGPTEIVGTLLKLHYLHRDLESKMQELMGRVKNTDYDDERDGEFFPCGKYYSQCNT